MNKKAKILKILCGFSGGCLIAAGLYFIYPPLAFIFVGSLFVAEAFTK